MAVVQRKMTYDELCQLPDDGVLYELLEGELVTRASPTPAHQQVVSRLSRLFAPVEDADHGTFYPGPIDVVFDRYNMPLPDGIFVTAARQDIVTGSGVLGAPDVVMEILSPTSMERDWSQKFATYQRFGVRSYWIVDLTAQQLHRFDLVGGRYAPEVLHGPADVLTSPMFPGVFLAVSRLFPSGRLPEHPAVSAQSPPLPLDPPQPIDHAQIARLERWHLRRGTSDRNADDAPAR